MPSCRPPHDDRPRWDPLSPGSEEGQRREVSSACAPGDVGAGAAARVQSRAAGCRAMVHTPVLLHFGPRRTGTCGLGELSRWWLRLGGGLTAPAPSVDGREQALGVERLLSSQHGVDGPPRWREG